VSRIGPDPEDFVVEEIPLYAPCGEGEHTFVCVEKRLLNTEDVVRSLARASGASPRDVGHAGRKDRVAVARQWLSVPGLDPARALGLAGPGWRVLEAARHRHRLRTAQLRGNRFEIRVRDVPPERVAAAPAVLAELCARGLPNRFGAQRFGRDGRNAARARELLAGSDPGRDRRAARFLLSALQAEVFNAVLERRTLPLDELEEGDLAMLHGSGGVFVVEDLAREQPRASAFEVSATGPIFGTRAPEPRGAPLERERAVLAELAIPCGAELRPPRGLRLRGARRPLRVRPEQASCESIGPNALLLRFGLPAGSYATVLIETLCGPFSRPVSGDSAESVAYPDPRAGGDS
jgi:tRNA pseudouridine13 synthase